MAASTRTKAVVALGLLDIARQVARAVSAKQQAQRDWTGFGEGFRTDARHLAHDLRGRVPSSFEWGVPPWRHEPTAGERLRAWGPIAAVIAVATAAVLVTARRVAHEQPELEADEVATGTRVAGAIKAGGTAIDAGVSKVVDGAAGAAIGSAAAVAAGSTAVKAAVVDRAKVELDERVVAPAKRKAITFGVAGAIGLTIYVVVIAVVVQLVVVALT